MFYIFCCYYQSLFIGLIEMTIEEIRKNEPFGATHYRFTHNEVEYLRKLSYHDTWYMWLKPINKWITTLWTKVEIGEKIKPL